MVRHAKFWIVPVVGLTVLVTGWATPAQEPDAPKTTTEKLKEKAGGVVQSIKKGAASAEEAIKNQYARAKDAVVKMGIEGRVYARLHWEKALNGSKIELSAPKKGVIALSGTVADPKAKAKAVELTADTIGVDEVVDHLTVQSDTAPATPPKP